jgi:hypothetical protein
VFKILVEKYVTAIRQGLVPDVDDAFLAVKKIINGQTIQIAVTNVANKLKQTKLPVSSKDLRDAFIDAQTEALQYLQKNVVHDEYQNESECQARV